MSKTDGKALKELKVDGDALKGDREVLNDNGEAVNAMKRH